MHLHRRSFVKYASLAAAGNIAGLKPFGALNALAQSTPDYKALVCIFLYGGNDGNNMVIPFDTAGYGNYKALRSAGGSSIALDQKILLPLGFRNSGYALHPSMPEVCNLINSGVAGVVANVGTLLQPTTRDQYLNNQAVSPSNLFSHPHQQIEWQNAARDGSTPTGWAGRIADSMQNVYNVGAQIPMITSMSGDTVFCNGLTSTPVSVVPGHLSGAGCSEGSECATRLAAAQSLVTLTSGVSLVTADNSITSDSYKYLATLNSATTGLSNLQTVFPASNGLASQLKQIAQIIQARSTLGVNRQIFFCGLGNFDTHSSQLDLQAGLLSQLSAALNSFYQSTVELGVQNSVTTFTMSDFARTFQPNSNTGTDHAWGSHHFVVGGAVKGNAMYGTFPTIALAGPSDSGSNGRWIPTTSSSQYASTLAQWFGVPTSSLGAIFPNIGNFSATDLGFMGGQSV
ncbi:uncharacterized protein (DUF1501 family) [Granulicella aggregans]|uniref:Uncharacterized protein (DUF1501 family) n=1 Tax=Granulicella aggregans TaxID=474949 RepID=A0A7W7ZIL5_9BACT|nr:DUF1501 domain-containing protein [Granulicella aggregans]MBB5059876.1 uncharacterized protein (DUF1501 family) [Granulicella aggregans]